MVYGGAGGFRGVHTALHRSDTQQLRVGCMALACSAGGLYRDMLMKQGCPPVLEHSLPVLTYLPVHRSTEMSMALLLYLCTGGSLSLFLQVEITLYHKGS